ncbi:MAG: sulfotransferase family protein [bacterium]
MLRIIKKVVWSFIHFLGRTEMFFLKAFYLKKKPLNPPIFIIGLPRSGTTILYQLLTHKFDLSYINNFIARHYKSPFLALLISKLIIKDKIHNCFTSNYGYSSSSVAPSEGGNLWKRWFKPEIAYYEKNMPLYKSMQQFRSFIYLWMKAQKKPIIIKNLRFGQRISVLYKIFPEALFIVIKRNPVYNLQSMYLAGEDMRESLKSWCPYKETLITNDKILLTYRIKEQIEAIYERDLKLFSKNQVLNLTYEDLCHNPANILKKANTFFLKNNVLVYNRNSSYDYHLKSSNIQRIKDEEFLRLISLSSK